MANLLDHFIAGYAMNRWIKHQTRKTFYEEIDKHKNADKHLVVQAAVTDYNDKKRK